MPYAELGYPVFPFSNRLKSAPLSQPGFKDAATDPEQIAAWVRPTFERLDRFDYCRPVGCRWTGKPRANEARALQSSSHHHDAVAPRWPTFCVWQAERSCLALLGGKDHCTGRCSLRWWLERCCPLQPTRRWRSLDRGLAPGCVSLAIARTASLTGRDSRWPR